MGFKIIFSNKYIFIRIVNMKLIIIVLYINDILIFIKIILLINDIKKGIKKVFKIKNIDLINKILDIQIYRNNDILIFD